MLPLSEKYRKIRGTYVQGLALFVASGIPWGSWNLSPAGKQGLVHFPNSPQVGSRARSSHLFGVRLGPQLKATFTLTPRRALKRNVHHTCAPPGSKGRSFVLGWQSVFGFQESVHFSEGLLSDSGDSCDLSSHQCPP